MHDIGEYRELKYGKTRNLSSKLNLIWKGSTEFPSASYVQHRMDVSSDKFLAVSCFGH